MLECSLMSRRGDHFEETRPFSPKELGELRRTLAGLSLDALRQFYERTHRDCQMVFNKLPTPKRIQTLVQVWKQLRKGRV
jgi:hypothetical protein